MSAATLAHGEPVLSARIRTTPEDFLVEEIDGFEATGSGEHLLLTIEKRGTNTAFAAAEIARWAGVPPMGVSYAGLKDRHAVTRQRFSVHLPKRVAPDLASLQSPDMQVIKSEWHSRKLPRGALAGNRFELILREVQGERDAIDERLKAIGAQGVPNYFGEQRFGRFGDNVANALAMFAGRRFGRDQRTLLLSAARSELFNQVLAARVSNGSWNRGLPGEVWMLEGSRSVFGPEPMTDAIEARLAEFDIHPTAPLWGRGHLRSTDDARALEEAVLDDPRAQSLRQGLEAAGLSQERRSTRLRPGGLRWDWLDRDVLKLVFELPPGTYATTLLAELGSVTDRLSESHDRH
ncbi:MAG TPA: tRNA pseudouridine(13) synthase TruD [Luteimonas sp.]|nr:tRNA pseudouridine(13) synthase TruD [Luteimonas sp.]